jgi:hypothetical protein
VTVFFALTKDRVPVDQVRPVAQEWLSEGPISVALVAAVWQETYGTQYAATAANYRALVRMILPLLHDRRDVPPPVWVRTGGPYAEAFSDYGARLVDGLVFHVAAMFGVESHGWALDVDVRSGTYGTPYVKPRRFAMPTNGIRALARLAKDPNSLSRLEFAFSIAPELLEGLPDDPLRDEEYPPPGVRPGRAPRGGLFGRKPSVPVPTLPEPIRPWPPIALSSDVPEAVPTVEQLLPGLSRSDMPGCTHEIWVDEAAEHVWGPDKFAAFQDKLAKQPGIDKVVGEDREIIHVNAPTLSDDEVLAAARRAAQ